MVSNLDKPQPQPFHTERMNKVHERDGALLRNLQPFPSQQIDSRAFKHFLLT